ncbi:MAG: hypothetical protein JNM85_03080 [Chthonomonas sp.]|nr:hypothetical protein [Chthonomonas sp.]
MPAHDATREERWGVIRHLVRSERLESQQSVVDRLSELGYNVTQSSVSRDLNRLGIVKSGGAYVLPAGPLGLGGSPLGAVLGATAAGDHLIVVRTAVGAANLVGVHLDENDLEGMVGTLAGDDTLFIATTDKGNQESILAFLGHPIQSA